jgi:hypothetical protein
MPWNPALPYKGLGFREIEAVARPAGFEVTEYPLAKS